MLLRIQKYNTTIVYKPGKDIPLADALSRISPLDKDEVTDINLTVHELEASLNATHARLKDLRIRIDQDPELHLLRETISTGWPESRSECPSILEPYWNYRDELAVEDGLLLKGTRLIIPKTMQQEILQQLHYGHLGMEKCKLRARSAVFWHGINKHIEDFVSTCSTCQKYRPSQSKEKFIPHEVPPCAWHTIATDLFT